jgi:hypothetical protein
VRAPRILIIFFLYKVMLLYYDMATHQARTPAAHQTRPYCCWSLQRSVHKDFLAGRGFTYSIAGSKDSLWQPNSAKCSRVWHGCWRSGQGMTLKASDQSALAKMKGTNGEVVA